MVEHNIEASFIAATLPIVLTNCVPILAREVVNDLHLEMVIITAKIETTLEEKKEK